MINLDKKLIVMTLFLNFSIDELIETNKTLSSNLLKFISQCQVIIITFKHRNIFKGAWDFFSIEASVLHSDRYAYTKLVSHLLL